MKNIEIIHINQQTLNMMKMVIWFVQMVESLILNWNVISMEISMVEQKKYMNVKVVQIAQIKMNVALKLRITGL